MGTITLHDHSRAIDACLAMMRSRRGWLAVALLGAADAWSHGAAPDHRSPGEASRKEQKAWGIAGEARRVTRSVAFEMTDSMRFVPDTLNVRSGETLRIVLRNTGRLRHEFVLGTRRELDQHAALMLRFPDMEHDEPHMAHVAPGQRGEVVWRFNRTGEFLFACLMAGHYQAGMVGRVTVRAR